MKYLLAGPLTDTVNGINQGGSSQPAFITGSITKSKFEDWKTERDIKQTM